MNKTLRWLWRVPGRKKGIVAVLALVQALYGASGVFYALLLRSIVDAAAAGERDAFWRSALMTLLLVAGQLALGAATRFLNELGRSELENSFKKRLLHALLHKDYAAVSAVHSAEWLNRLTNDAVLVAGSFVEILPGLVGMAVKLISALIMLVVLDRRFAAILIPGGMLLAALTYAFRRVLKRLHKAVQEQDGQLRIFLQERIGSMLILRSFAAEEQTEAEAAAKMRAHKNARMRRNRFSNVCNVGFGAAMNGMYLFGVIWCGYGILTGTISFGTLTAITQLIAQIQAPFANITGYLPRFYTMTASAERLMEIEDYGEDEGTPRPLAEVTEFYEKSFSSIELENASFTYYPAARSLNELSKERQSVVLSGLNLSVRKGETLAFTGPSGCGKSTVLKLLMCLYPLDEGSRRLLDREGGERELDFRWRRLFAYVPQGNALMSGTVREVVSFAEPERRGDDEAISSALRIACADFVHELPDGMDTLLGERGTGLSEGQMQRLSVARAIFSGSPILLLDEATSALDAASEKRLLQNLRELTDKTVIIVTHRPAALEICDRVLRFTENGTEEETMEKGRGKA